MRVFARTDVGKLRPINEDSFYAPNPGEFFCAVADGMGGHNAGEVASGIAVKRFGECMREARPPYDQAIKQAVESANAAIYAAARGKPEYNGMGTTMTALCEHGKDVFIAHVGDSRAYLLRNGAIVPVTKDHTLVEEMVESGLITIEEARVHPKRNYITRALGTGPDVQVDVLRLDRRSHDVYLLCSDGLSNHVTEREMRDTLMTAESGEAAVERLVQIALERGGPDNITAMIATCEEDPE